MLFACALLAAVISFSIMAPPTTLYMFSEARRLGGVDRQWVALEEVSPVMIRSIMAAEDADFCRHWGFDIPAIRAALRDGARRGASTISQQMVKNLFLWQGRSWTRKALEGVITPLVEAVWSKRRIMEVYLNVIEFDEGVFGIAAAARHYFQLSPSDLNALQAARLAMVLPAPKHRDAARPTEAQRRRTAAIMEGAATLAADGRAICATS
ncbi:MAG: monofunctional biosynthetic peptidoglycan transglycosylase [Pseudomonadota bacterium]